MPNATLNLNGAAEPLAWIVAEYGPVSPRTKPGSDNVVIARFAATDGACRNTVQRGGGASGRITIDAIDAKRIRGSYSVRFDSGDALNGMFDAPVCDVPIPTETSCAR